MSKSVKSVEKSKSQSWFDIKKDCLKIQKIPLDDSFNEWLSRPVDRQAKERLLFGDWNVVGRG